MNYKKIFFLIPLFLTITLYSQKKVLIIDAETKKAIPEVRLEFNNTIFYTNDDGNVILPIDAKEINIFSPEYLQQDNMIVKDTIKMLIKYKNIDEVVITKIDAKKIIKDVLKDFNKNYETRNSIYSGTFKSKSKINNELNRLVIIDMDLWTLNNRYDYNKKVDNFLQVNLRNKKYDKNRKSDKTYIFNRKDDFNNKITINGFLQRLFLFNQLSIIDFYTENIKINGTIVNINENLETINFKSDRVDKGGILFFEGKMIYNKKENVITYLKVSQIQEKTTDTFINVFEDKITTDTNSFTATYEMYKKSDKYVPTKITMDYIANLMLKNKSYPALVTEEFIFKNQYLTNKNGLSNKIDLSRNLLDNIIDNSIKDSPTLLSTEEQAFVNEP